MTKSKKTIKVNGKLYERLYDENGNLPEDVTKVTTSIEEHEELIEEMKQAGLMEIIKHKNTKYYRMIGIEETKPTSVPFNVLNLK